MFSRIVVAALVALPALVSATPAPAKSHTNSAVGQCDVGTLQCCNTQQTPDHTSAAASGLLGIPINLGAFLGFDCTPITVVGVSGNNCAAQPVCCQQNTFTGLVNALNCSPVNVNL